jgi:beta-lactam-binding protein with PASTA domain/tRNA A-37 threonylcarbamoyl transferase component Bud32
MAISGVTDLAGRVLADRYRLLAPIGTGASGRVYVADDARLRRRVAVKVLHAALADDAGFLRRFRSEAQLAASLHHPNIVTVYDWGEDDVPFMVLELLEGGSLRGLLDKGQRLTPAQAAYVGAQVADALAYAHARGIVHRDLKPANLLFDEHGIVRLADLGLARALAEASWTEPAGAVLGTARYASPEQAIGSPLDGRSDLYSLALVISESVTGRVPLAGDTPIGTLAARTQRPVTAPVELGPLAPAVERAGRIEPDDRYPDADTMRDALTDALRSLPPPSPMALAGLGRVVDDPHPTQVVVSTTEFFDQDADLEALVPETRQVRRHARRAQRLKFAPFVVGGLIAVVLAVAMAFLFAGSTGTATVPQFVGRSEADATTAAKRAGVKVKVTTVESDDPAGIVVGQDPPPGNTVEAKSIVTLKVSSGPPPVALPDVLKLAPPDAQRALEAASFVVTVERRFDETIAKDTVIGTEPAQGQKAPPESVVKLVVSDGPKPVPVPDVAGLSYDEAAARLVAVKLKAGEGGDYSDTVPTGTVIGSNPAVGTDAPRDSTVTVIVSLGPPIVAIPNVIGSTVESATAKLESVGLQADIDNYKPGKKVRAMSPKPGKTVRRGTKVTLFL